MDAMVQFLLSFQGPMPYVLVVGILLACGLGLPIPEDITLFAAGLLAYYGNANVYLMIGVSFLGVMAGDSIIFFLGAKYGRKLTKKWFFSKVLLPDRLAAVQTRLHKQGNKLIFMARFMPGLRAPIYFTCGTLHIPFRRFFLFDGLAALISVPAIVYTVFYFGDELDRIIQVIRRVQYGILIVIFGIIALAVAKWWMESRKKA